jgi:hypothetical protein
MRMHSHIIESALLEAPPNTRRNILLVSSADALPGKGWGLCTLSQPASRQCKPVQGSRLVRKHPSGRYQCGSWPWAESTQV